MKKALPSIFYLIFVIGCAFLSLNIATLIGIHFNTQTNYIRVIAAFICVGLVYTLTFPAWAIYVLVAKTFGAEKPKLELTLGSGFASFHDLIGINKILKKISNKIYKEK